MKNLHLIIVVKRNYKVHIHMTILRNPKLGSTFVVVYMTANPLLTVGFMGEVSLV